MNPLIDILMVLWVALACVWVAWETGRLLDWWDGLQQAPTPQPLHPRKTS
jgi:hypothetical protein